MAMEDPGAEQTPIMQFIDHIFTGLYTVEMLLKIMGMGFIMSKTSYLRDGWNILDFLIVITSYIPLLQLAMQDNNQLQNQEVGPQIDQSSNIGFSSLRTFRVLRPLKTISSVQGLKLIMQALFAAMPLLVDTLMILTFFFFVFSIMGSQLFTGLLKQRCIAIQTGMPHPDDLICGIDLKCPGGFFCGKSNRNPNYGVSNFDTIFYSLLMVFQSVTLEGWSDLMVEMEKAFVPFVIYCFMIPLVFIGAFFLLNLTLAVINSSFNEQQKRHQNAKDNQDENQQTADVEAEMEKKLENINELSIAQYINARVYARKMVEFLRMRQHIKQIEKERVEQLKQKMSKRRQAIQTVTHHFTPLKIQTDNEKLQKDQVKEPLQMTQNEIYDHSSLDIDSGSKYFDKQEETQNSIIDFGKDNEKQYKIIIEEDGEHHDDRSDKEQNLHLKNVQNLIKNGKDHLRMKGKQAIDIKTPKRIDNSPFTDNKLDWNERKMMGNIGLTKQGVVIGNKENRLLDTIIKDLDIDNVLGNQNEISFNKTEISKPNVFELYTHNMDTKNVRSNNQDKKRKVEEALMIDNSDSVEEDQSGLVTSDSDFDDDVKQAGIITPNPNTHDNLTRSVAVTNQRQEVSKTFKRMLTQNFKRAGQNYIYPSNLIQPFGNSTEKPTDSIISGTRYIHDFENTSINSEIENKYVRRKFQRKQFWNKSFLEDQNSMISTQLHENYLIPSNGCVYKKRERSDYRILQEMISIQRPKNPFDSVNPLTHKVIISNDIKYNSTSQQEIFMSRYLQQEINQKMNNNKFLLLSKKVDQFSDDEIEEHGSRTRFKPYQQKVEYKALTDSSDHNEDSSVSPDDDDRCGEEQPYITPRYFHYKKSIDHLKINEIAKRSDIVISSTLSFNTIPKDTRIISSIHRVNMSKQDIEEYIYERNNFLAMLKEYQYQRGNIREKDLGFKNVYLKSFIHRSNFSAKTLKDFKNKVQDLNQNKILLDVKDEEIAKLERIKYEQNKKSVQKLEISGFPVYDLTNINKLLQGQVYDQLDENEQPEPVKNTKKQNQKHMDDDQMYGQSRLESQLIQWTDYAKMNLRKQPDNQVQHVDEIPDLVRREFHLPLEMTNFRINFKNIKLHDAGKKRLRPIWSGQDVLPLKLNNEKSMKMLDQINYHRVWPEPVFQNIYKRFRFLLRKIVKSGYFDSLMTFMVVLNSVTLALERHGIQPEERILLDTFDQWFTNIFIVEMTSKLIAIGVKKYLMDRMNWLDGSVVMMSIFEIVYKELQSGQMNLQGFKTLRLFRTLRVFRVMRVLRALKSMQMIVSVMAKSYMSFIYITMLMFLFIYIFALLCMTIFGASMNFPDGTPRSNFDSMLESTVSTFQVLTMENWQQILFSLMRSDQNDKFVVSFILMGWIFLGNFILLNLFLAILLDAFLEEEDEQEGDQVEQEKNQIIKMRKAQLKQQKRDKDKLKMRIVGQKKKEKSALAKMLMGDQNYESEDLEDLDEDQIIQIFKQQGIIKKSKDEQMEIKLYQGPPFIECQMSLYMFSKENKFRQMAYKMIKHPAWDNTIILLIILSSIKLASDTYINKSDEVSQIVKVSNIADDIFNYSFIVELTVKVIAMGLFMDGGSYLRESWNQLDFFIVLSSIIDMVLQAISDGQSIGSVRILRLLRVLRPLRMISRNPDLKLMVSALMESIGHIMNVLVVISIIYMIFAILGVNLFAGKLFYCSEDPLKIKDQIECERAGGEWMSRDHNFDDVAFGFNTLLVVASLEGWPDIMFYAADSVDVDVGPKINDNLPLAFGFFLVYIMIGSFFLLNLFIGVLFVKFNQAKSENEKGLKQQDLAWMDIQRLILSQSPEYETTNVPKNLRRQKIHELVTSRAFEIIIMSCIVLNMLQMALEFEGSSDQYKYGLKFSNYIFSGVFIIEASLKLIAFGSSYFENGWNKFDFFVVTASILDIAMEIIGGTALQGIAFMPSLIRVFRVVRVTRLFKLAGSLKGLQAIIQTIIFSIGQLSNVVLLLFIILFMFTVLAVELFGQITIGDVISSYKNFGNFHQSMLLLLAMMTGEDWNRVMFDCSRTKEDGCIEGQNCGSWLAFFYFNGLIVVCSYVMLQLFILVIIQQFDKYYLSQDNTIKTFKEDLEKFYKIWKIFTQKRYRCYKIKENQLQMFFRELGGNNGENSLGFNREIPSQELKKHILKMGIKSNNGYIFFNELLYRCMRKKFGSMKLSRQMQIFELKTQYNIFLISQEVQQNNVDNKIQSKKVVKSTSENIYNDLIQKSGGFNPFLTEMNYKITFRTWLKFARQRLAKEREGLDARRSSFQKKAREEMVKYIDVEIEIQKEVEWTSEEEAIDAYSSVKSNRLATSLKKSNKFKRSQSQLSGSIAHNMSEHKEKINDHLTVFEKSMKQKFKYQKTMRAKKNNDMVSTPSKSVKNQNNSPIQIVKNSKGQSAKK